MKKKHKRGPGRHIIVIGGALAGPVAAVKARETDEHAVITIIERNENISYSLTALGYRLSGEIADDQMLNRETPEFFRSRYNIDVMIRTSVEKILRREKKIRIRREGETIDLDYDTLIFALGVESEKPSALATLTTEPENFSCFRTLGDLRKIRENLNPGSTCLISGAGSFGLEAADALIRAGIKVILLEADRDFLPEFDATVSGAVYRELSGKCRILTGRHLEKMEADGGKIRQVVLSDGEKISVDMVIAAQGILPRTTLLAESGFKLAKDGSVKIDQYCRTEDENILACGVAVRVRDSHGRKRMLAQAAIADRTAVVAGANAAGGKARIGNFSGSFVAAVGSLAYGRTGLSYRRALASRGKKVGRLAVTAPPREKFFGGEPMLMSVVFDRVRETLLGAEFCGREGVDKRIDALSYFVRSQASLEDLANHDFAHEPRFSNYRDIINVAGQIALEQCRREAHGVHPAEYAAEPDRWFIVDLSGSDASAFKTEIASLRSGIPGDIPSKKDILCVCEDGKQAFLAHKILRAAGYRASYLSGGRAALGMIR